MALVPSSTALSIVGLLTQGGSMDTNILLVIFLRENMFTPFSLDSLKRPFGKLLFDLSISSKWKLYCIYDL